MKKYLIVLAAAMVALASCNKGEQYTSLKFKEAEVTIGEGYTSKLTLLYEPTNLPEPECVWASSDTNVIKVDQSGNIEAWSIGEVNVTATYGEGENALKAVCKVIVKDPLELIEWSGFSWWSAVDHKPLTTDTIEVTLSSGQLVHCVPGLVNFWVWDDGIFYDENQGLQGAGYAMFGQGMGLIITEDLGKGANYYILSSNYVEILEDFNKADTAYLFCAPSGVITGTAEDNWNYFNDTTETLLPAWTGTEIFAVNFGTGRYIDGLSGLAQRGIFVGDEESLQYRFNASMFTGYDTAYGLVWEQEEDGSWSPKVPYEWAPRKDFYYEKIDAQEAPKYNLVPTARKMPDLKSFKKAANVKDVLMHK